MNLKLEGCSNPGLSFTPFRINQILEIAEWIDNKSNEKKIGYIE